MEKKQKRMGLGRGLSALLPEKELPLEENNGLLNESNEILIDFIETNPYQPRTYFDIAALTELKESIQVQGIIQPITVRRLSESKYQLISGERRLQASKLAGLTKIPAYVKEATDNQMLEMGLIENIQRENLNPIEVALAYKRLIEDCNLKLEDLGGRVGKDRSTVNNFLRLLNLPLFVQDGLKTKKLSMGHARALLGIDFIQTEKIYKEIISKELSVRKVEEIVKEYNSVKKEKAAASKTKKTVAALGDWQNKFAGFFNQKVSVLADEQSKGEIKIAFNSKTDFENIINKLKK
jgi:ParB family transcriptional regulator, chromosome partitioning protein